MSLLHEAQPSCTSPRGFLGVLHRFMIATTAIRYELTALNPAVPRLEDFLEPTSLHDSNHSYQIQAYCTKLNPTVHRLEDFLESCGAHSSRPSPMHGTSFTTVEPRKSGEARLSSWQHATEISYEGACTAASYISAPMQQSVSPHSMPALCRQTAWMNRKNCNRYVCWAGNHYPSRDFLNKTFVMKASSESGPQHVAV